jgi:hypothetical protein
VKYKFRSGAAEIDEFADELAALHDQKAGTHRAPPLNARHRLNALFGAARSGSRLGRCSPPSGRIAIVLSRVERQNSKSKS